jgi:hypothetical protein
MKRLKLSAILLAMLAGQAYAQQQPMADKDPIVLEQERKKKDAADIDKQYKSTLEKTNQAVAPVRNDPWSSMRGPDDSKTKR